MIKEIQKLTSADRKVLMSAPALLSALVATSDRELNEKEKEDAFNLSHLRTYTAEPELQPYYTEVEKHFKQQFDEISKEYATLSPEEKREFKLEKLSQINEVIAKLGLIDKKYAIAMQQSLNSYKNHVRKSYRSALEYFIFPYPVPGITD